MFKKEIWSFFPFRPTTWFVVISPWKRCSWITPTHSNKHCLTQIFLTGSHNMIHTGGVSFFLFFLFSWEELFYVITGCPLIKVPPSRCNPPTPETEAGTVCRKKPLTPFEHSGHWTTASGKTFVSYYYIIVKNSHRLRSDLITVMFLLISRLCFPACLRRLSVSRV